MNRFALIVTLLIAVQLQAFAQEKNKDPRTPEKKDIYGGTPLRVIDGKIYDFSPAIEALNEYDYLMLGYPEPTWVNIPNKRERVAKNAPFFERYKGFSVRGKVVQILPDGMILQSTTHYGGYGEPVLKFLQNHPRQDKLADGDWVQVLALPLGPKQFKTTDGAVKTIRAYDYGKAVPENVSKDKILELPIEP